MQLFYNPDIDENSTSIHFPKEESRHIVKVLRKQIGDVLHITNGNGWLFEAQIELLDNKNCYASVFSKKKQKQRQYQLHLVVAPTKMNDRFEWFLEKATEIGIDTITPILCAHSERKVIKTERLEKILQSAMKQSLQCYLPILNPLIPYRDYIKQEHAGQLFIAHCEESDRKLLKDEVTQNKDVTILIGPEGDFSVKEIEMALHHNYIPVTLGKTRLRTETAAIVACHSVAFINE